MEGAIALLTAKGAIAFLPALQQKIKRGVGAKHSGIKIKDF